MRKIVVLTIFAMLLSMVPVANAGAVALTISGNEVPTTGGDITITWTASGFTYSDNDTIEFTITDEEGDAATWTPVAAGTADEDLDDDTSDDGSFSFNAGSATYTIATASNVMDATMSLSFGIPASQEGNYAIAMNDGTNDDFGIALIYIDDANDVNVTATVAPQLEFDILTSDATEDTNECDLGQLSPNTSSTCAYNLRVLTNASNGYVVEVKSDGELRTATATIDGYEGATFPTGTSSEAYSVKVTPNATTTGATVSEQNEWATNTYVDIGASGDHDYTSSAADMIQSDGPNFPEDTLDTSNIVYVEHEAKSSDTTETGSYEQVVTYYVTASF